MYLNSGRSIENERPFCSNMPVKLSVCSRFQPHIHTGHFFCIWHHLDVLLAGPARVLDTKSVSWFSFQPLRATRQLTCYD